jgi:hypothetical protein
MNEQRVRDLMSDVAKARCSVDHAVSALRTLPFEAVDSFAKIDHHRALRRSAPEAVFCAGKTADQVAAIFQCMAAKSDRVLGTRASADQFAAARLLVTDLEYDAVARCIWLDRTAKEPRRNGALIVTAGTSDIPVAAEAAITLRLLSYAAPQIHDVGVAGIHRLLAQLPSLRAARVLIVVAGMEGALPSAVAGLVAAPIVAVPTSIGYGASFGGIAALLGMLNSCAPGVGVVNIDNGFGAACLAASMLDLANTSNSVQSERQP